MNKVLLAGFAAITAFTGGPAIAADMPAKAVAPAMVRPACAQFGGFYIGAHAGWGYYDYKWSDRDAWSAENSNDLGRGTVVNSDSGFLGGVQGGWNWQRGCTVFGVEADYSWMRIKNSAFETDGDLAADLDSLTIESRLQGLGTIRLRTGVVVDNLLLYLTGGFAVGDFERSFTQTDNNVPISEIFRHDDFRWGWTAGFGTEWAFSPNWSIKSEVLYTRFESDGETFTCTVFCGVPEPKRFDSHDEVWTTKIGINYRWGGRF
jgi:outer membrane immunogenic protein